MAATSLNKSLSGNCSIDRSEIGIEVEVEVEIGIGIGIGIEIE